MCQYKDVLVGGFYVFIHFLLLKKHVDTHNSDTGEIWPQLWPERRRLAVDLSKVIPAVSQPHVGNVASAVTQLLCQHSSHSVIFLWPPGARSMPLCIHLNKKRTNNNRKRGVMTGKASVGKIRKAQVKCQRCLVWDSTGTSAASLGRHSTASLTWHFSSALNVSA